MNVQPFQPLQHSHLTDAPHLGRSRPDVACQRYMAQGQRRILAEQGSKSGCIIHNKRNPGRTAGLPDQFRSSGTFSL